MFGENVHAVTLNLYGTLTSLDTNPVFEREFQGLLSDTEIATLSARFSEHMCSFFEWIPFCRVSDGHSFLKVREMVRATLLRLTREMNIQYRVTGCLDGIMDAFKRPSLYHDAESVLGYLASRYPICVLADADDDLALSALRWCGLENIPLITSETAQQYKASPGSRMFRHALRLLGTSAEHTVHIGDSASDIWGARRARVPVIHVDRHYQGIPDGCPPANATVSNLWEAEACLEKSQELAISA